MGRALPVAGVVVGIALLLAKPQPRLIWNASASAAIGLYDLHMDRRVQKGELALVWAPWEAALLANARGYLPLGVPLIKHVAALSGDRICARNGNITINGIRVAQTLMHDHLGRRLPHWNGCQTLQPSQIFLLNAGVPDSFDGRYFGVSRAKDVIGRLEPLWLP